MPATCLAKTKCRSMGVGPIPQGAMIGIPHFSVLCGLVALLFAPCAAAQSQAAGSAESQKVTLSGKVAGDGAARSRITVYQSRMVNGTAEPVAGGVAGQNGEFALREVPWFRGYDWMCNCVIVAAQARNRVGLLQIRGDGQEARAAIELRPTCRLRGVVRDEDSGQPIVGASVWPMIFGDPDKNEPLIWPTEPILPWHTLTDAEGRFELVDVPVYGCYVLDVSGQQHARRLVRVEGSSKPTEVRLSPAGRIVGSVQLADGKPAEGIAVWASGGDGFARTKTDAAGRFSFESLAAETYSVSTIREDGPKVVAAGIMVGAGSTSPDVDLRFSATGFVIGRLVDSASGKSIKGDAMGYVSTVGPQDGVQRVDSSARIQEDGSFRIEVPAGRNKLTIVLPGWSGAAVETEVRVGQETKLDVRLQRGEPPRRR